MWSRWKGEEDGDVHGASEGVGRRRVDEVECLFEVAVLVEEDLETVCECAWLFWMSVTAYR